VAYFAGHLHMTSTRLLHFTLAMFFFTSCSQLKSLSSRDNSVARAPAKPQDVKKVQFLNNISVTPGEEVSSRHSTTDPGNNRPARRKNEPLITGGYLGGDIERAGFLQLKYAIALDATVEKLTNIQLLQLIDDWWGTRYCMGGSTKNCIDCSAFVQVIMSNIYNVSIPRTAQEQYDNGSKIGMEELKEGDLVFFRTTGRSVSHVGVYLLNNKFVHASTSGGVMVNDLNDSYWKTRFSGAARVADNAIGSR